MRKTPKILEDSTPVPATLAEQSDDGQPVLRKYAGAVHIGADLTLYQRRAFNVLLFWAMPEMPSTTRHEIDILALDASDAWMEIKETGREQIVNPAGVAYKAITEGWHLGSNEKETGTTETPAYEDIHQVKLIRSHQERLETIESDFCRKWYVEFIERTPESELNLLRSAFEETLVASASDRLILGKYRKQGLTGIARGLFQHFLASQGIRPTDEEVEAYIQSTHDQGGKP